jgi:hypothetical protein
LAAERTAQLQQSVEGLRSRQERAFQESRRLEATRKLEATKEAEPAIPPGEEPALEELTKEQHRLDGETSSLAGKLAVAEVVRSALKSAASEMAMAAALLDRHQTGQLTQEAQQKAVARLAELLAALIRQAEKPSGAGSPQELVARKVPVPQVSGQPPAKPGAEAGKPGTQPAKAVAQGRSGDGQGAGAAALRAQIDRLWGSLPERQREQMSQLPGAEEFLPKYEVLLEEYFKRLAEQQDNRNAD